MGEPQRRYKERNREMLRAKGLAYYHTHREQSENARLKRKYGIALEERAQMSLDQGGKCAGCDSNWECVDHAHVNADGSGPVRGLLCQSCNKILGLAREDPMRLVNLAEYLAT